MEQQEKDRQAEALWSVLANPAEKRLHLYDLQNLVNYNPQSGLLHMLIARSGNEAFIKSAAVYYNSLSLFKLVNGREPLAEVKPEQIINLDTLQSEQAPPLDPLLTQEFSGYEPTIEDLARAEINKRKFGSETEWSIYDDLEDQQSPEPAHLNEPEIATTHYTEPVIDDAPAESPAEVTLNETIATPTTELTPLVVNEEAAAVTDNTSAESEQPSVNYHDRYRDYTVAETEHEPEVFQVPEPIYTEQPRAQEPVVPLPEADTVNTWQTLKYDEVDQRLQEIQEKKPHQEPVIAPVVSYDEPADPLAGEPVQHVEPAEEKVEEYTNPVEQLQYPESVETEDISEEMHPDFDYPITQTAHTIPVQLQSEEIKPAYEQPVQQPENEKDVHQNNVVEPEPVKVETIDYQTVKPASETEIEDEVYDEITSIDDFFINPVPSTAKSAATIIPAFIPVGKQPEANVAEAHRPVQAESNGVPADVQKEDAEQIHFVTAEQLSEQQNDEAIIEEEIPYIVPEPEEEPVFAAHIPDPDTAATVNDIPVHSSPVEEFDDLIASNIVTSDYFAFRNSLKEEPVAPKAEPKPVQPEEPHIVSKYHDDNMPYSFMWWLDKTRREHAGIYQPYVQPVNHFAKAGSSAQQQPEPKKKEEQIINRFIKEEPQIKPPSSDKLDNENKARTSAEDRDELVTETLARIYIDQMLFHKAIATYKKLIVRFPEKSSYFASQIELLENKIN
ncbi:hypothetical protein [Mucilaginibacter sp. KACC 22063]|uniref:hypothetical protein n=1 Tax=Mucilaginibacter sp. KACC 22063 TaxID=3025666 RepID=UPI002366B5C7|nr:hypothetical protein [Mucilaginibacter sp. KACC 22063]WDF55949.1 hypothetical protein PQ461_02605 [Mucilaginibacter sp. KACC 22063]